MLLHHVETALKNLFVMAHNHLYHRTYLSPASVYSLEHNTLQQLKLTMDKDLRGRYSHIYETFAFDDKIFIFAYFGWSEFDPKTNSIARRNDIEGADVVKRRGSFRILPTPTKDGNMDVLIIPTAESTDLLALLSHAFVLNMKKNRLEKPPIRQYEKMEIDGNSIN
jgi:hypothetical protein